MLRPDTLAMTALLALMTALGPLSTDMYLPSLPTIGADLSVPTASVQLTLSAFLLGFAAGQIIYGPFSDKYGRKPLLYLGLGMFAFASFLCAVAPTIDLLIVARFFQSLGASGPIVLARAVVRDLYDGPRAGRELSRMGTIMGVVPAIAPVLGGVMHEALGWRSVFVFCLVWGLGAILVVMFKLPETLKIRNEASISPLGILRGFAGLAKHRAFLAYMALLSLTYGGLFSYISASSFILQGVYGLRELAFGFAFSIGVFGYIAGTIASQRIVPRRGLEAAMRLGVACLSIAGVAMLAAVLFGPGHPAEIIAPMVVYLFGVGLVMPQAMASALMPFPDRAGTASSFLGLVQMLTGAAIGILVGHALGASALPLPIAIAATGVLTFLIFHGSAAVRARAAAAGR